VATQDELAAELEVLSRKLAKVLREVEALKTSTLRMNIGWSVTPTLLFKKLSRNQT
jgi:hypothetical protein